MGKSKNHRSHLTLFSALAKGKHQLLIDKERKKALEERLEQQHA